MDPPAIAVFLIAGLLGRSNPPATGEVRAGAAGPHPSWRKHGFFLAALALACVPALAGAYYAYAVAHPGLFLSMGGGGPRSVLRLLADFAYVLDVGLLVRWAAKHVGPAFAWLCLLLVLAWHVLWRGAAPARRVLAAEATCLALGGYWIAQAAFGQLGLAVAYPPFGYAAEIRDATVRRAALAGLAGQIVGPIARAGGASAITAPTLDGPYLAHRCSSLFEYNLSTVREAYFARVPLTGQAGTGLPPRTPAASTVVAPASPEWTIHRDPFDPEAKPILRLAVERVAPAPSGEIALSVVFRSDLAGPQAGGTLRLPATTGSGFTVDLRQLYAFSLSRRVEDLRVVFTAPGSYRILRAELGPP